jgi:hypothetical protein
MLNAHVRDNFLALFGTTGIMVSGTHMVGPIIDSGGLTVMQGNVGIGAAAGTNVGLNMPVAYSVNAAAGIALGGGFSPTLVAQANNDQLVGLQIAPTFSDNTKTSVTHIALSTTGALSFAGLNTQGAGGGAAPTFATIGGSGPAAAAQWGWIPITINGTVTWLMGWR